MWDSSHSQPPPAPVDLACHELSWTLLARGHEQQQPSGLQDPPPPVVTPRAQGINVSNTRGMFG